MKKLFRIGVIGTMLMSVFPMVANAQMPDGCAYWIRHYNITQDLLTYYEWGCYQYGGDYCDMAQQLFVALGNIGNMIDYLNCYH